jgi:PAS domain S-box-containing protein
MDPDALNWPGRRTLAVGYAVAIAVLVLNAIVTFWNLRAVRTTWDSLAAGRDFVRGIDSVLSELKDAETGQRGYLLTGDKRYLEPYTRSHDVIPTSIERLRSLAGDSGNRQRHLNAVAEASAAKLAELEKAISVRIQSGLEAAVEVVRTDLGEQTMDRLRYELVAMRAEEDATRAPLRAQLQSAIGRTTYTFAFVSLQALALLFGVHLLSERNRSQLHRHATWLSTTLRSIGDAVIATDGEGRVIYMNAVAEGLTGWSVDAARGKPLQEIFRITNEQTGATVESPVDKVLRDGVIVGLANHTVLTAKDGTHRPIEDSAAPIRNGRNTLGVVLVFHDASEARDAETRIRASEERYRSLVAATTQTVWIASPDFNSSVTLTGQDPIGRADEGKRAVGWLDAIHPEDRERTRQAFVEAAKAKAVCEIEHRIMSLTGTFRHYLARAVPLVDNAGNIREWIGTSNDITERRLAEEARERLYHELRENDKRKDEFLAMLAHELRNPLAAIGNAVTLSTRTGLQEHLDWSMEVINRQIKHLTRLIDDLLDVSRISRGKIALRSSVLDVTPILDNVVEILRPLIEERKHELTISMDRGNLWVNADPTRLEQIVTNLVTNAAKYTDNRGHIWINAGNDREDVVITVKDTGVGIPPERIPEMFELFAQGDRTLARSEGGLGIGLTVVKKLVELHNGSITARSEGVNTGSEFSIRLPAARRPAGNKLLGNGPAAAPRCPVRILVVDDNVDMAKGLARLLTFVGHDIKIAHDGPNAIAVARDHRPLIVLLDIGLPGMDGYEVASMLRHDGSCPGAVFIAISGYGQDDDIRRSKNAGFDHYLVKPIDHDALLSLVSAAAPG